MSVQPIESYNDANGYTDIDRTAASALRSPLLPLLHMIPVGDRAQWLASLVEGFRDGVVQGVEVDRTSEAYAVGQRMSLLLTEEGHA